MKSRTQIGSITTFRALEHMRKLSSGQISRKEYSQLSSKDFENITIPIFADEIKFEGSEKSQDENKYTRT